MSIHRPGKRTPHTNQGHTGSHAWEQSENQGSWEMSLQCAEGAEGAEKFL